MSAPSFDTDVLEVFGIPLFRIWYEDSEALNRELGELILNLRRTSEGRILPNIRGWHSHKDLHLTNSPCIEELLRRIAHLTHQMVQAMVPQPRPDHFQNWSIEAWANLTERGEINDSHIHSINRGALWSGVYYVDVGTNAERCGGQTTFEDISGLPMESAGSSWPPSREYVLEPRPGLMVLFPATLRHRVERVLADAPRLTIAWNLFHPGFTVPRPPAPTRRESWMWRNFRGVMLPLAKAKARLRPGRPLEPVCIAPFPID